MSLLLAHDCALCEQTQGKSKMPQTSPPIVILGAGSIGVAFAAALSGSGARVVIADPDAERRADVGG